MTDKAKHEIIMDFALGYTVEEVTELEGITLPEAVALQKALANEIDAARAAMNEY